METQDAKSFFLKGNAKDIDPYSSDLERLDELNEEELLTFEQKWKDDWLPKWRLYALFPYNLLMGGLTFYYTLNFKYFSKKFFKPKRFGVLEILKYGTIQSVAFLAVYIPGTLAVTGLWHPITYLHGLAKIKGKVIDNQLRFDESMQSNFLFGMMEYFGLSKDLLDKAKQDLEQQREELEKRGYFMKNDDDEVEDEDEGNKDESKKE